MLNEASEQYDYALKQGQKYYRTCVMHGQYPYPQVLDELIDESMCAGHESLGIVDIPAELIVGTKSVGRKNSFAGNFMPLLPHETEFGSKWVQLCKAHLSDEGIRDPIKCYEYMGRFYVAEGNKRVSVLKSYGAPNIPGKVTRIVPEYSEDTPVQVYYEFMHFYKLSGTYLVSFTRPGSYAKLQAALGFEAEHVWTENERRAFTSSFIRFRDAFIPVQPEGGKITPAAALLVWLRVHGFSEIHDMTAAELTASIEAVLPDIQLLISDIQIEVSAAPEKGPQPGFLDRIIGTGRPTHLNIAFIYTSSPENSAWTHGHDMGRIYLEEKLGDKVSVRTYLTTLADAEETMEQAVAEGAQVIFATTPPLISACLRVSVRHPAVKILDCALSLPFTGVRTYYSRLYEAKFITGAIAGAMAKEDHIGYVANYPIMGVPAAINAFALGAQLTHPGVKIKLRWSCLPDDPVAEFEAEGIHVISNRDTVAKEHRAWAYNWGTYILMPDGSCRPLTSSCWNWGKLYRKIIQSIFDGGWSLAAAKALPVNYFWGMSSGVIDVEISSSVPSGVHQLADILKQGIKSGAVDPFFRTVRDQSGALRCDGETHLTLDEVISMNWLCDNVEGSIPAFEDTLETSHELIRLLGIYRDSIPPEKEGVIL